MFNLIRIKQVGLNYNDTSHRVMLSQDKCIEECPASCSNQWSYFKRSPYPGHSKAFTRIVKDLVIGYFVVDTSINVSCGKD